MYVVSHTPLLKEVFLLLSILLYSITDVFYIAYLYEILKKRLLVLKIRKKINCF